ncbi:MAG TPA: hypothetical protein VEB22_01905 [Phycisphaerales bacterium]|nr:hypothetical protein [Phycisphaerales bacterium]
MRCAAAIALLAAVSAAAQDFMAVPYVVLAAPNRFTELFNSVRGHPLHAVIIGDS